MKWRILEEKVYFGNKRKGCVDFWKIFSKFIKGEKYFYENRREDVQNINFKKFIKIWKNFNFFLKLILPDFRIIMAWKIFQNFLLARKSRCVASLIISMILVRLRFILRVKKSVLFRARIMWFCQDFLICDMKNFLKFL